MATLKLTIFKAKVLKDGKHKIRIAVCHKQETCYIVTRYIIDELSQFKNGQVIKRPDAAIINTKLRNLLNIYQERLDKIDNVSLYSCSQLKKIIEHDSEEKTNETFQMACDDYVNELLKNDQKGYANLLTSSKATFIEYTNGDIYLSDITPELIEGYNTYLMKKKWSKATIGIAIRNVKTIINKAIKKRKVIYKVHPFIDFQIPSAPVRDVSLELISIRKIINAHVSDKRLVVARDIFSLSFYLGGINLIDLLGIDFRKENVSYQRTKVRNRTSEENTTVLPIHAAAKTIIDRWMDKKTGRLNFGYNFTYKNFSRYLSRSIIKLAKIVEIEERVVYYSARKTFAQFASELGIPDGVIDYCLGHSDKSKGIIRYYTKVKQKQAEIAINRVIDYVNNPEKYTEFLEMRADIMMMKG